MSKKEIEAFAAACAKAARKEPAEAVRVGPTLWMLGSPAPADPGMVGLATSSTQTVFLRKEDLVEVRESDGRYLVCIAADANVLVREEQVGRLEPGGCRCHETETEGALASKKGGGDHRPGPIIINCQTTCSFETVCGPYYDPQSRAVIVLCWPKLVCRNPCEGVLI
jgi:hypothetical protein